MRRAAAVLALVLLAGCGIPISGGAEPVEEVPFGLLDPEAAEPVETTGPPEGPLVQIYLIDPSGQTMMPVERRVTDATLPAVMDSLLDGPTAAELGDGFSTALTDEGAVASVELVGGVASVDLTEDFTVLEGPTQRLAIAQMVLTLTGRPGVGRVSFTLGSQPIDIPRGDGTLATGSVSRDNYRELLPAS